MVVHYVVSTCIQKYWSDGGIGLLCAGRVLSEEEKAELVAAACYMHVAREDTAKQFLNQDRYV